MSNPFYATPTTTSSGDTSPGGGAVQGVTQIDNTYDAGNPFASQAPVWQSGQNAARITKYQNEQKQDEVEAAKPTPLLTSIGSTITALPHAASQILSSTFQHPVQTGESVLGGLMDAGPAAVNVLSHVGLGMLKSIYGAAGVHSSEQPIDLPLPGQTMNEYIGNNSDVSQAENTAAKTVASYELGGAAAKGIGLGGVTVDAAGNTISRATLFSRVAGNIVGGQLITDPNATLADRTKQAAFDTAFGVVDTAARGVASSLKASKLATEAVSEAKNTVMNSAISSFEDASNPAHNPEVAGQLRDFLNSKAFDSSRNMVDFETKLQGALGDNFNDATVQKALQPIIDAGHQQVAKAVGVNAPTPPPKRFSPADLVGNLDEAKTKLDATPREPAKVKYVASDNLGKDEYGNKRMAQTQVDTRTGNAVISYDRSLDANPAAKKIVIDHEQGHILDKQLNGGNNISSSFGNYQGNKADLDAALGDFAKKTGNGVAETAANLKNDIGVLSGRPDDPVNEQFADAVAAYRNDPAAAFDKAPTFAKLMNYVPQDASISEHSTSMESLKQESPIAGKQVADGIKEGEKAVDTHVESRGDIVSVNGKHYQLSGDSLKKYTDAKAAYDESTAKLRETVQNGSGSSAEYAAKRLKAEGMQFSALKRELTGDLTTTEIENKVRKEQTNYSGKNVKVEINGKQVDGTIVGTPAYGNIKVRLNEGTIGDGSVVTVKTSSITDSRSFKNIRDQVTARPESKEYSPYKAAGEELAAEKTAEAEGKPAPKPKTPTAPKIASTGLDTGKRIEGKLSFNPDKINAPQDVETLFNKMEAENGSFSEQRVSKSNEDIKNLSRLVGLKPEDLINAKPGSIANAETLTAARQLVLNKAQAFADNLRGININTASDAQLAALKDDYARLTAMQQTVAGLRSEAANTLRSLSLEVQPGEDFTLKQSFQALKDFGASQGWDTSAFASKVGGDMQKTLPQKIAGGALKTWYASILSGPATYLRHFTGVEANQFVDILSKGFNPKTMAELPTSLTTAFKSVPDAIEEFKKTFKVGDENPNFDEIKNEPVFSGKGAIAKNANLAIEFTGRTMTALASGYRKIASSVEGASLKVASPAMTEDVSDALSKAYADQINYLDDPKGFISQRLMAGAKAMTQGAYNPLKLIFPFTRVVTNIIDRQFDYIPGTSAIRAFNIDGGLSEQTAKIMTKYGLTSEADSNAIFQRLKNQQIGRMTMGMAFTVPAAIAAHAGLISGSGPSDYNQKTELEQTGWRPDSVKIGNTWVPSSFLGPLGGILLMAGNISDAAQYDKTIDSNDYTGIVSKGLLGWGQSQLSKSFLSGASNLLGALSDPSKAATYFKNLGAELLPIPKAATFAVGAVKTAQGDDYQYQTGGVVDKIRAELGLTGTLGGTVLALDPSTDAFGRPLKADLIYGLEPSVSKADGVDSYLQANDIVITIPSKGTKYTDPATGKKISMTPSQYNKYVTESGKLIYQNLAAMIPDLQGEDIDSQRSDIRSMLDDIRGTTRDQILSSK